MNKTAGAIMQRIPHTTRFLMASIGAGGTIHALMCQGTHRMKRRCFPLSLCAFLCASGFAGLCAEPFTVDHSGLRARVVIVHDAAATEAFEPRLNIVRAMVNRAITNLTGKATSREAWLDLVTTQDVVGIKVFSAPGPNSGTRPVVTEAVVRGLMDAGLPPSQIVVWDKQEADLRVAGYWRMAERLGIRCVATMRAGFDVEVYYDTPLIGSLIWSDLEFGDKGEGIARKSYVSKLLTKDITRIINITPLLNNNDAGVSGNLYGLTLGGVDNTRRFERDATRLARAVPEIYALPVFSDRVALNVVDALICQYQGNERGLLHYSSVLNELRFSRDPVALDVLSLRELDRQRRAVHSRELRPNLELYQNATLLELGVSDFSKIDVERLK
jgi:uncharacterized protein (DUF362 family)